MLPNRISLLPITQFLLQECNWKALSQVMKMSRSDKVNLQSLFQKNE